jgi:hypothetical protein
MILLGLWVSLMLREKGILFTFALFLVMKVVNLQFGVGLGGLRFLVL